MFDNSIKAVPLTVLTGQMPDISPLLRFHFWQRVYFVTPKKHREYPSKSFEKIGHIVGISEHCGHAMTWKVYDPETGKVVPRSQCRPVSPADPNFRAVPDSGEESSGTDPVIKSRKDGTDDNTTPVFADQTYVPPNPDAIVDPEELIGRTFLLNEREDGQRFRARVVRQLDEHEADLDGQPERIKFLCSVHDDQFEEIITYNQLLDYINKDENPVVWKYKRIVAHEGPLDQNHPSYNGSSYNVKIEWENGEVTTEPLRVIAADDPVSCAIYARDNGILHLPGWKRFRSIARRQKTFTRMINQAKLRSFNTAPRFKYGFEVPRNYAHAMQLDERNGNDKWKIAVETELSQIKEYQAFRDHEHKDKVRAPEGYKRITVHLVFDVKHDGRHKARLVAGGHLTEVPVDAVYSGVVSLRGFRLALFLAELNGLDTWATDIGNAYLEAETSEKVYVIAGPEFGPLQGHILIIHKALYGLRSSGFQWHERFADCLAEMGFKPCKAEPDIWMRPSKTGNHYEYVAVYVDDLALVLDKPQEFTQFLENEYNFKLKGTGPITFHLGMDIIRDSEGVLCIQPKKYIEKMVANYTRMFSEPPTSRVYSPLDKGDHPELDESELLGPTGITQYQSLIGSLQWAVSIGRFDITTAVMTLSGFRAAPRRGHLDRAKRVVGYLSKMRHGAIRIRTGEPDYSNVPHVKYDWASSVYGNVEEMIPKDAPTPPWKTRRDDTLCRRELDARHGVRQVCYWSPPPRKPDPDRLVLEEASYRGNRHIRIRVRRCAHMRRTGRGYSYHAPVPWRSPPRPILHVWRQRIRC